MSQDLAGFKNKASLKKFAKLYALASILYQNTDIDNIVEEEMRKYTIKQFMRMNIPSDWLSKAASYEKFKKWYIENNT